MPKLKLTDASVGHSTLPPDKVDLVLWDTEVAGFGLRIRPASKTFIVAYRPAGAGRSANMKRMKIAPAGAVKVAEARKLARIELGKIAAGADPLAVRSATKQRSKARLDDLLDRYAKDLERRNYVNSKVVIANLRRRMAHLLNRDVANITGADLVAIIEKAEAGGRPGAAQSFRQLARAFFSWVVTKAKVLKENPLAGYRRERPTRADRVAKKTHGRAFTDAELATIWQVSDPETAFGRLVRFWALTGCRRGEGAGLTWSMVDRTRGVIDLPAAFVKQGRGHVVPIAPALAELLDACPRDARSDLVFASPRTGGKMGGFTQLLDRLRKATGFVVFPHDLRRTFRTGLSRLDIDVDTAELALGHARGDLEAIYNRDDAHDRLRLAFDTWAAHVERIVAEGDATTAKQGVFA